MFPALHTWPSLDTASGARTFVRLRWAWLALELGGAGVAYFGYGASWYLLLPLLALGWVSHLGLSFVKPSGLLPHVAGAAMVFDAMRLTVLLGLAGGASTPMSAAYLVQVVLGALLVPPGWIAAVVLVAVLGYGTLFLSSEPMHHMHDMQAHNLGMWVSIALVAPFVAASVALLRSLLLRASLDVQEASAQRERDARLTALGTLAAGAAHELATPLSTIAVAAEALSDKVQHDDELAQDVTLVREEVGRCRRILSQLAADVGAGMGELHRQTDVGDLLDDTLAALDVSDRAAALERIELLGEDRLFERPIRVPSRLVAHALSGLVKNALQATEKHKSVALEAREETDALVLEVRDPGAGMPPDVLSRAQEPFFTTKPMGEGTGLGLFVAASVAQHLGGRLSLESRPEEGTTVRLHLPWEEIRA